ncbi:MAG TPA: hypothetical protein VFS15_08470 [Kofleriaceae bacterium]|nr:hypothetical protein [Kofleriaceae bacterium]
MRLAAPLILLATLAGCPGDDDGNPSTLWLAPDGSEIKLKLQDEEPPPW